MKHWHHIVPRHAGGTDDSSNLVELTIEEHAEAHRVLWEEHGQRADFMAWKMLSGQMTKAEAIKAIQKLPKPESWKKAMQETWTDEKREAHGKRCAWNGKKRPEAVGKAISAAKGKYYTIITPTGETFTTFNLKKWCAEAGLNYGGVRKECLYRNRTYRGYRASWQTR